MPLALCLGLLLPIKVLRASQESSLWIDETYSLAITQLPPDQIVDSSANDTNPPGYFLLLKAWLKLGKAIVGTPGILWARSLGILIWLGFTVGTWWLGRRLLGRTAAALTWAVAASAYAALFAKDLRGYSVAAPALFLAFLALLVLAHEGPAVSGRVGLWSLYAGCVAAALWTHTLSAIAAGLLGILFLALARKRRSLRWPGALAHAAAFASFLPFAWRLGGQVRALAVGAPTWMTPATGWSWLSVFVWWFPFGPIVPPGSAPRWLYLAALGALSAVAPILLAVVAARRGASRPAGEHGAASLLARAGMSLALAFTTALWLLQRLGVAQVFHAPRYPALVAAFWAAGLVGCAAWGTGEGTPRVWLPLLPWLAAALLGQVIVQRDEARRGFAAVDARRILPAEGATVFVTPPELAPFHRTELARYEVRAIDELPCAAASLREVQVLDLNFWRSLARPRDLIAEQALRDHSLAKDVRSVAFPAPENDYTLYTLSGIDRDSAARWCAAGGFVAQHRDIPPGAVAVAFPEDQLIASGWSFLEVGPQRDVFRWGAAGRVLVKFDRRVAAGRYVLHYRGFRADRPQPQAVLTLRAGAEVRRQVVAAGELDVSLPIVLGRSTRVELEVEHPVWSPAGAGSADTRRLAAAFRYAWIEPSEAPRPQSP